MIKNCFKIAWRNIVKHRFYAALNIVGLFVGIVFSLLIGAYVYNELQVNTQLRNADRQYYLQSIWKDPNMGPDITTLGPIAKRLKEEYPGLVANYYRWDGITSGVSKGDKHFREDIQLGDSTLLNMYGFKLLYGNVATALSEPFSVVITQAIAKKYFGKTDVVGQPISIQSFLGGNHDFTITGVLKEVPENSVTQLNSDNHNTIFIPTNTFTYFGHNDLESWNDIYIVSYIELQPGVSPARLELPLKKLIQQNASSAISQNLTIRAVALQVYYREKNSALVMHMIYTLSFVGLFILLMAVANFINMAISGSGSRMKEIGIRKVLGSLRKELIIQFLSESLILVTIAMVLALAAYPFLQNVFGSLFGKEIPSLSAFPWYYIFVPLVLIFIVGLSAGSYPALVLSSINTVDSLKGKLKSAKENVGLRKSLVGFQFCIAMIVMVCAFIVSQQVTSFFGQNLGYNKDYIVASQVPRDWSAQGVNRMITIRNEFASMPQVCNVTLSYEIPNGNNGSQPPVYRFGSDSTRAIAMQSLVADENYLSTYQIPLSAGAFFDERGLDSGKIILNKKAVDALGYPSSASAVGQQVRIPGDPTIFTIKGVTADFQFGSMQQAIQPMIFFNARTMKVYRYLSFKLKPGNINADIEAIQKKWSTLLPGSSFEYRFMDDTLKNLYATELQLRKAADTATVLLIVIVLLGVVGLISLNIHKRVKEIGIRKVLGANVKNIMLLFVKEFAAIIVVAAVIACPIAYFAMNKWLENYAYHINISALPFIISLLLLAAITLSLICLQTIKAAAANPVKSLRSE
jgi:putative ABC transport system permease protein